MKYFSPHPAPPTKESLTYLSSSNLNKPGPRLTSIVDQSKTSSVELSVVIPAYNEEKRLREGLLDALTWLEQWRSTHSYTSKDESRTWQTGTYEVIIVDDGSKDRTAAVALELAVEHAKSSDRPEHGEIRVVQLGKNRGKGGAVRHVCFFPILRLSSPLKTDTQALRFTKSSIGHPLRSWSSHPFCGCRWRIQLFRLGASDE